MHKCVCVCVCGGGLYVYCLIYLSDKHITTNIPHHCPCVSPKSATKEKSNALAKVSTSNTVADRAHEAENGSAPQRPTRR